MKDNIDRIQKWAIDKIRNEYREDVALLVAVDGFSVNGDGHGESFDYFIPATERGYELSQTFIIDGVGHDLYPRDWERTERTADMDDWAIFCVGNSRIVYSRSIEEEKRFLKLKKRLQDHLQDRHYMYRKALSQLDVAMDIYRTLLFEDSFHKGLMAAGKVADFLKNAIYFLNGTYDRNLGNSLVKDELIDSNRYETPEGFNQYFLRLLKARDTNILKDLTYQMIRTTRKFIMSRKPDSDRSPDTKSFIGLAEWYQELSLFFRRIRFYCETQQIIEAFADACNLQNELMVICQEYGLEEQDLMSAFDPDTLMDLHDRTWEIERFVIARIEEQGIALKSYQTVSDFLAEN